jgi:hypothetical protein
METTRIVEILGWTGTILSLLAYALVPAKKMESESLLYRGMNTIAVIVVVVYARCLQAYATAGLNAVRIVIGPYTLERKWLTRN